MSKVLEYLQLFFIAYSLVMGGIYSLLHEWSKANNHLLWAIIFMIFLLAKLYRDDRQ